MRRPAPERSFDAGVQAFRLLFSRGPFIASVKRNYTAIVVILPFSTRAPFAGGTLYSISSRRLFL
jgi:hypothetical protein